MSIEMIKQEQDNSYLFSGNANYLEEIYKSYLNNSQSVPDNWRVYFDKLQNFCTKNTAYSITNNISSTNKQEICVQALINAYRFLGLRIANLDPLKRQKYPKIPELDPKFYGLTDIHLDQSFDTRNLYFGYDKLTLRNLLENLHNSYCGTIGVEFMYISNSEQKCWWEKKIESTYAKPNFSAERKKKILERITAAEGLEIFLHKKYVGQKRFSLEGSESLIIAMDQLIHSGSERGVQEVIIGMAHRGRLNVLVNILGKMPKDLFDEFEGKHVDDLPAGDVKYHKGFSSNFITKYGILHLSLAFNPSHLEIVNPVIEGSVKARIDCRVNYKGYEVLPVQIHGDAAFSGQGVVMETLNLAKTRGYGTYGTLHIIINNQIGFTTSDPRDTRSTLYCSDVVKMIEAPVLHVNGDDPEAVALVTEWAIEYRNTYHKDVVIDIVCFRKLGHNEQDTPALTQPLMYKSISQHPGSRLIYANKLITEGIINTKEVELLVNNFRQNMENGLHSPLIKQKLCKSDNKYSQNWKPFLNQEWNNNIKTSISLDELQYLGKRITTIPNNFKLHKLVERVLNDRRDMINKKRLLDWGMAEHLAFASLLNAGYAVRLTGQDSGRGTFSHRHAVLHDQNRERWDDGDYIPLQNISSSQGKFTVIDSVLSEEAVLGFEYGYSTVNPQTLVLWEAQFGDFVNGAQVVVDQFISSGEVKWGRMSGLTMLLPHGYEGQGPEHSSARIERFLQLCADNNMQVIQPTTPAQIFHLLRRQIMMKCRKPLIIFTPKSLLRHKEAVSELNILANDNFQPIISEIKIINPKNIIRMIICSGRVYFDLIKYRRENNDNYTDKTVIIRIEQLYPFCQNELRYELQKFNYPHEIIWVQDEPQNQGPWFYIKDYLIENLKTGQKFAYVGRPASASPAVGYYAKHCEQQKYLVESAFMPIKNARIK